MTLETDFAIKALEIVTVTPLYCKHLVTDFPKNGCKCSRQYNDDLLNAGN